MSAHRCARRAARTGPDRRKSASNSAITSRAVGAPPGSSHRGISPNTMRGRARENTARAETASPSGRADTAVPRRRRGTARSPPAGRTRTAFRATRVSCVSVPPTSMPLASPGLMTSTLWMADGAGGFGAAEAPCERVAVVTALASRAGPRASAREMPRCRTWCQPREQGRVVAVTDERLRRQR